MDRFQAFKPHNTVKFRQHSVEIIHDVISGIPYMTGIHTYTHLIRKFNSVKNFPKLLKTSSDLAPFPAMVSRSTVVWKSRFRISFNISAI